MDSSLATILTGAGVAGVFCVLFIIGWIYPKSVVDDLKAERDILRQRVETERDRAETAVAAAQAARDVFAALQAGMALRTQRPDDGSAAVLEHPPELQGQGPT